MKIYEKKKIVIMVLCTILCIMIIGYAAFNTVLNISGNANIESNWDILFTTIEEVNKTEGITIQETPRVDKTTATFTVGLKKPGDYIEYRITIENRGTLDAVIEDIVAKEDGTNALKYEIEGINLGDKLSHGSSTTFIIRLSYDNSITSQPTNTSNSLAVTINYVQDLGQGITPSEPVITKYTLAEKILKDNSVTKDTNIDFSKTSEEDGTKGVYYTNTNTEDGKPVYYYRGAVENNYVSFAGFYWRIIRINEDGSVRLIYQGTNATSSSIGISAFNTQGNDNAYVGYMYGKEASNNYSETHANINDSTMKTVLDTWYQQNLLSYDNYIEDSGFCGDRSIASEPLLWETNDTALGYGTNLTYYGSYNRIFKNYQPQFTCPQENDLYTTKRSTKGNKALDYPIGLITVDEVMYAGGGSTTNNTTYYLNSGYNYWTMSSRWFNSASARGIMVFSTGNFSHSNIANTIDVRPVINLKADIEITSGDGTSTNPYRII